MRGRTFAQMLRQHPLFAGLLTLQSLFVLLLLAALARRKTFTTARRAALRQLCGRFVLGGRLAFWLVMGYNTLICAHCTGICGNQFI